MHKLAYIMVGVAGSGKSTLVTKLVSDHKAHLELLGRADEMPYVFSLDDIRLKMLTDHEPEKMKQSNFYAEAFALCNSKKEEFDSRISAAWKEALTANIVIVDNVNLTRKSRARWVTDLKNKNFRIFAIQVIVPLAVAIQRQSTRNDKAVPAEVVKDMYFRQQEVLPSVEASAVITVDGTLTPLITLN